MRIPIRYHQKLAGYNHVEGDCSLAWLSEMDGGWKWTKARFRQNRACFRIGRKRRREKSVVEEMRVPKQIPHHINNSLSPFSRFCKLWFLTIKNAFKCLTIPLAHLLHSIHVQPLDWKIKTIGTCQKLCQRVQYIIRHILTYKKQHQKSSRLYHTELKCHSITGSIAVTESYNRRCKKFERSHSLLDWMKK